MFDTAAYLKHEKHHALYDALQESMQVDELQARLGSAKTSTKKRSHNDQEPPENCEGGRKIKRRKGVGGSLLKKGKAQVDTSRYGKSRKEFPKQSWYNDLVDAKEEPEEHELQNGSVAMFGKCMNKFLNKDNITKEDLEEADFPYLNQNNIEDLYLLKIQNKIYNINGVDEFDLINALELYIQRIMIKKRVEDV
ncbi:hypothetical protein Tco_0359841 [Tanacetum coccineum]